MYPLENIYKPSVALVFGYLVDIDNRPKKARINGLNDRFSIAFDTYNPEVGELYFDTSMFENIFSNVFLEFKFDHIEVAFNDIETHIFTNIVDAMVAIKANEKRESDPCVRIMLYLNKRLVCYVETEFYMAFGGPYPYHDTYNFAFFVSKMNFEIVQMNIEKTCKKYNYTIRTIERGLSIPQNTIWNRIKSVLFQ